MATSYFLKESLTCILACRFCQPIFEMEKDYSRFREEIKKALSNLFCFQEQQSLRKETRKKSRAMFGFFEVVLCLNVFLMITNLSD